ncbi:hypothetical protein AMK21_22435 [Streptomyces sp. CB00316]|nr:hypothetical protein AMK21_22435 [Streptomyces sp. CB00316]
MGILVHTPWVVRGWKGGFFMKRTSRVVVGMAAVAALAGIPTTAQAAPEAAEWTLNFDGLDPTPSWADMRSHWFGTCPVPHQTFTVFIEGEALNGMASAVRCTPEGTYRFAVPHNDYNRQDARIERGQKYKATFAAPPTTVGTATTVIE